VTLEQVMALEGAALNEAVAERLGWKRADYDGGWSMPDGSKTNKFHIPEFCEEWNAAMTVREWARRLDSESRKAWVYRVIDCIDARMAECPTLALLDAEPIDYARAALLVEP
jgi:hypothetical protein